MERMLSLLSGAAARVPFMWVAMLGHFLNRLRNRHHHQSTRLNRAILSAPAGAHLVLFGLDDADRLERTLGQMGLDQLIRQLCFRLKLSLDSHDKVLRLGHTDIAILLHNPTDTGALIHQIYQLQTALDDPLKLAGQIVFPSMSAVFALIDKDREKVVEASQTTLSDALPNGPAAIRGVVTIPKVQKPSQLKVITALENGEIVPWYQPQLDLESGRIIGVEALCRWENPQLGPLSPADFLAQIEQTHHSETLFRHMLKCALRDVIDWRKAGAHIPRVGLNLSRQELCNPDLSNIIHNTLKQHGLEAKVLSIEILENSFSFKDNDLAVQNVSTLSKMGCYIALDDFGTGSATISLLQDLPVNGLKIDRSFVSNAPFDTTKRNLLRGITAMADRLQLDVLAEGVETESERVLMYDIGCQAVQGFLFAKPMPNNQMARWTNDYCPKMAQTSKIAVLRA